MSDRTAATVGFVFAGIAVAGTVPVWPGGLRVLAAGLAAIAFLGLAMRRYGRLGPGAVDGVSIVAGLGAGTVAAVSLIGPSVGPGTGTVGLEPLVTAAAGLGAAVLAYADYHGIDRQGLLGRSQSGLTALAVGLAGLISLFAWSIAIGGFYRGAIGTIAPSTGAVLSSVALGFGTATVAGLYLRTTDRGLEFIDLRWPERRDAAYVVVGIVVLLGVNLGLGLLFRELGLEAAQHTIYDVARDDPGLLLVLMPLSILLIGPGEELLYRNIVQKSLYGAFSRRGAIVVASAIFAVVHVPAYSSAGSTPLSVLNTLLVVFALSIVLGVAFERRRNVIVPALIHGSFNAIAFAAAYAELVG